MPKNKASIAARFDPDPSHYVITEVEFNRLCEVARIPEKENVFFLLGLLVPCAINSYTALPVEEETISVGFVLNTIVVCVTLLLIIFQGRAWYSKRRTFREFIDGVKERPEGRLVFNTPTNQMFVTTKPSKDG